MDPSRNDEAVTEQPVNEAEKLAQQRNNGANWFFWIAGLSLVNSVIILSGGEWNFIIGLGITQIFDVVAAMATEEAGAEAGSIIFGISVAMNLFVLAMFVGFGVLGRKGKTWAFAVGMVLYGLDGLLFLMIGDWLSVAFHAFALACLFGGMAANRKLAALPVQERMQPEMTAEPITP
jgi:hypothetical protein